MGKSNYIFLTMFLRDEYNVEPKGLRSGSMDTSDIIGA